MKSFIEESFNKAKEELEKLTAEINKGEAQLNEMKSLQLQLNGSLKTYQEMYAEATKDETSAEVVEEK